MPSGAHPDEPSIPKPGPSEVRTLAEFGAAIARLRRARGWTQSDLAEWMGTNWFTIHRLEAGRPVGLAVALDAVAFLGSSVVIRPRGSDE